MIEEDYPADDMLLQVNQLANEDQVEDEDDGPSDDMLINISEQPLVSGERKYWPMCNGMNSQRCVESSEFMTTGVKMF